MRSRSGFSARSISASPIVLTSSARCCAWACNYGPAVARGDDWFGATVNLSARVADEAAGGEVLLGAATHKAAGEVSGVRTESLGLRRPRNIESPVELLRAVLAERAAQALPLGPVCHMAVDPAHCAGSPARNGANYHFCSLECVARSARDSDRYTA